MQFVERLFTCMIAIVGVLLSKHSYLTEAKPPKYENYFSKSPSLDTNSSDTEILPPPGINYLSLVMMMVGLVALLTCCTRGKLIFKAIQEVLEDNAGLPFPQVTLTKSYASAHFSPMPAKLATESSTDLVSSDSGTTLNAVTPLDVEPVFLEPAANDGAAHHHGRTPPNMTTPGPVADPLAAVVARETVYKVSSV